MRNKNTTDKIRPQYEGDRHASPLKFWNTARSEWVSQLGRKNKQVRQAVNLTYLLKIRHASNK